MSDSTFASLEDLAAHLRDILDTKKYILLYAYNGTGKTRLSIAFKDLGKQGDERDTLYFNAFTEDLFTWDNDLDGDSERVLKLNSTSRFFAGLDELEMENRIRPFLRRYATFDFSIDYQTWTVTFSREIQTGGTTQTIDNIKVSRGEENFFIWCFFLAIVQLAMDGAEAYRWVKYLYIDDPISSLDENNAIAIAHNLGQLLKRQAGEIRTVISSHHTLFFNVLCNELSNAKKYFLSYRREPNHYMIRDTGDTPFFHHVAMLIELYQASQSGQIYTYHFNILRSILEKSASFHGYSGFAACIKQDADDPEGILYARVINLLSHDGYSLYEPREMLDENKAYFRKILNDFLSRYPFNSDLFAAASEEAEAS